MAWIGEAFARVPYAVIMVAVGVVLVVVGVVLEIRKRKNNKGKQDDGPADNRLRRR